MVGVVSTSLLAGTLGATAPPAPVGVLQAPGGPFLHDRYGRAVLLHGVNLVYKVPPYEVVTTGRGPNVLTAQQASRMAELGFNVVRLGIIWKGLEPGKVGMNDPAICTPGVPRPSGPGQFDRTVFDSYLAKLESTITLLSRHGIYSLLDMHQDVYNEAFAGEGAPDWAVCTDGAQPQPQRNVPDWSVNLNGPGVATAYAHLWRNDVVGNLQGEFDTVWARVAAHFRADPWVIGYDPINEPWDQSLPPTTDGTVFDAQLQCLYAGRTQPGRNQEGQAITCPANDPATGVVPQIEAADPNHLVFPEGNFETDSGVPNHIGPMPFPRLVVNFHNYCLLHVPNGPEPPDFASTCAPLENRVFDLWSEDRAGDATAAQPGGPAWMLTEFGATTDAADLARISSDANAHLVGWTYWQWLNYDDPTGSHSSALWPPRPATPAQFSVLSQPYTQAVAGTPTSMSFDASSGAFRLTYIARTGLTQPTVVFIPADHYPRGYCTSVTGGRTVSRRNATHLDIVNDPGATGVSVSVDPEPC